LRNCYKEKKKLCERNTNGRIMAIRKDHSPGLVVPRNTTRCSDPFLIYAVPLCFSVGAYILMRRVVLLIVISPFGKIYGRNDSGFAGYTGIAAREAKD
jgi:hypothetical protein